jgi:YidC/Oxa1 family membrane protein insertase
MDRKSIIILVCSLAVLFLLNSVVDRIWPPPPPSLTTSTSGTNGVVDTNVVVATNDVPQHQVSVAVTNQAMAVAQPSAPEQILTVSNQNLIFHFTSHGGGLKTVELTNYQALVGRTNGMDGDDNLASLNLNAPLPVLDVVGRDLQGDNNFTLTRSNTTVRAEKMLANGLRLVKEFNTAYTGTNYLFHATVHFENTSSAPISLSQRAVVIGTATPIGALDDSSAQGAIWYNGNKATDVGTAWFANRTLGCIPGTPRTEFEDGASNVVWAAAHSQFFALAAIPAQPAPGISVHPVLLPLPDTNGLDIANARSSRAGNFTLLTNGYQTEFDYPVTTLAPHQAWDVAFTFYAGPKEYDTLAKLGTFMGNNLDLIMGFTGFLGFGFVSKILLISMTTIHSVLPQYGLCIIAITVTIKLIFWPMMAASTRSQKRLQALQPQLKAISDKYKDDPLKKHEKTTAFLKENKVNPMGSCLPMLIQLPVFYGFYSMLRSAIELRGTHFLWATDLTQPDTVGYIAGFPINPLPLIMGITQLWQAHTTPPQPGMDPAQQKLMKFMPLLFIAFFYRMSAGLTLYWTISNLLTIAQVKFTRTDPAPVVAVAPVARKKK